MRRQRTKQQDLNEGRNMDKGAHVGRFMRSSVSQRCPRCSGGGGMRATGGADSGGDVTLEFAQWWEPELPDGAFRGLMDEFEAENPGIKVKLCQRAVRLDQGAALRRSGLRHHVRRRRPRRRLGQRLRQAGRDRRPVGAHDRAGYDDSQLASQIQVDGTTYMIPVVNFVYPMFTNDDLLAKAGVTAPPSTRTEFADAAEKITALGGDAGWVLPLVARGAERRPERRHVVGVGLGRLDARRTASPT